MWDQESVFPVKVRITAVTTTYFQDGKALEKTESHPYLGVYTVLRSSLLQEL